MDWLLWASTRSRKSGSKNSPLVKLRVFLQRMGVSKAGQIGKVVVVHVHGVADEGIAAFQVLVQRARCGRAGPEGFRPTGCNGQIW